MAFYDISPASLILVAIMPEPADLDYARVLGWYRIPVCTAPRVLSVDYLAFYQPASFGSKKWRVEYSAPVLGHELVLRRELLRDEVDHPRADQEYYKLQLGPLQQLPRPIRSGQWKRFTFLYTTGYYLLRARQLTDLAVRPRERRELWTALREKARMEEVYMEDEGKGDLPLEAVLAYLSLPGRTA